MSLRKVRIYGPTRGRGATKPQGVTPAAQIACPVTGESGNQTARRTYTVSD